ncbi:MAG: chemotaxis protein CheR [Acidobacteriota bacterium]|nr:chemotaxis protein CheR [Acidobacteriota bacterium]
MRDDDGVAFLQWALPSMGMQWAGFRKVRRQVCRRISRRMRSLGLTEEGTYREYLNGHPDEWITLAGLCRVTISRFYRDRGTYEHLGAVVLPQVAAAAQRRGDTQLRCWSAGCASGEEPYSVALSWLFRVGEAARGVALRILGTDIDPLLLRRAGRACYPHSSVRELPREWTQRAFTRASGAGDDYCLLPEYRKDVAFACQDIRAAMPAGRFDLILCRNLVFTYFDEVWQERLAMELARKLHAGGALVVGCHETVPHGVASIEPAPGPRGIFVKL